jgi:copper chaperone
MTVTLAITGMSCDHCVRHLRHALGRVPGVTVHQVSVGRALVDYSGEPDALAAILRAVDDAGYEARVVEAA